MGQATVDLPDPAEQPPAPVGSADDLLSQMAGEEIDRMLADADARSGDGAEPADAAPLPADDPFAAPPTAAVETATVEPPVAATEAPALAIPLESIAEPLPVTPEPTALTLADETVTAGLPADAEVSVDPNELNALLASAPSPAPVVESAPPATAPPAPLERVVPDPTDLAATLNQVAETSRANRPGVAVRLLELLNAPLRSCPDDIRDVVGKLAILTFMNAMGVLLYLMLFKK